MIGDRQIPPPSPPPRGYRPAGPRTTEPSKGPPGKTTSARVPQAVVLREILAQLVEIKNTLRKIEDTLSGGRR